MNSEEIYVGLGRLIENPPLSAPSDDVMRWLGRAYAYASDMGCLLEATRISAALDNLYANGSDASIRQALTALYRVLALAEMKAPASVQGSFIAAGNSFDALAAIGKVLSAAQNTALIVDPYMDEKALTDFAILANEGVVVHLLTDSQTVKPSLSPAVKRWAQQYGSHRPLIARVAWQPKQLHDRVIIVDEQTVWTLTQSLNAFATRSPATIVRIDGDAVPLKLAAYKDFWLNGLELP